MLRSSLTALGGILVVTVATTACPPPDDAPGPDAPKRTTFGFEPIAFDGIEPRWGAASTGDFVLGGVNVDSAVISDVYKMEPKDDGDTVEAKLVGILQTTRMCHCAFFDENRSELVVIGGRKGPNFFDSNDAEAINVETGEHVDVAANGAADHPVGCQAFFSKDEDKGFVFGGLSSDQGQFTNKTYRYDPDAHAFTELDVTGPVGRYDAGVHQRDDGTFLLVSGMGLLGGVKFFQDIWSFDPKTEAWTEQKPAQGSPLPPGRRYPWTSLAPDESVLLFGFGSDSGQGLTVLRDLWAFHFDTNTWEEQDVDGELPEARGFTYNVRGPADSAGALLFGLSGSPPGSTLGTTFEDAYALRVPDDLVGRWH